MAAKVTKIYMDIYRKLEKSGLLNVIERLQILILSKSVIYIIYNENMSKSIYQSMHRFFCLYHLSLTIDMKHASQYMVQGMYMIIIVN
jgi:hypothetical protein